MNSLKHKSIKALGTAVNIQVDDLILGPKIYHLGPLTEEQFAEWILTDLSPEDYEWPLGYSRNESSVMETPIYSTIGKFKSPILHEWVEEDAPKV